MIQTLARELSLAPAQVAALAELFAEGATVPFIARYRKERTGGLDEVQIRDVQERLEYLTELKERKDTVLASILEQGKLTDPLKAQILSAPTKQVLEDLYLPFKPKRRTRATIAKELGLEPLAELMVTGGDLEGWIAAYVPPEGTERDSLKILKGARDILAERIAEDPRPKEDLRRLCRALGEIETEVKPEFEKEKTKFTDYYAFKEPLKKIPAHRFLAIRRGEEEKVLRVKLNLPTQEVLDQLQRLWVNPGCNRAQMEMAVQDAWDRLLSSTVEVELRMELKTKSDEESIQVFGQNMRDLLLAPLGGAKVVMGLDPGFRTGTKWVVLDGNGKLLEHGVMFPVEPQNRVAESRQTIKTQIERHGVQVICLGNGTASREVFGFLRAFLKDSGYQDRVTPLIVSESGASIYSASDIAREEFPELDVTVRGAISIARRFQDPLAELVKIDPKSIGVGQYQHDVNQRLLKKRLDETVESCVNHVGVNLNTASAPLLSYVSGLNANLAKAIVSTRDQLGGFASREDLKKVPRFGPKTFEQAAGFLRISGGKEPLDRSAVHPENYPLVRKMATDLGLKVEGLIGNQASLGKLDLKAYQNEQVGLLTLKDIMVELLKPGRDPRKEFVAAKLQDEVQGLEDLKPGMELEGTVTNLTKFGAFVDIGVHQDGLIHLSELSDHFIKDPSEVCSVGQVLKVRVLAVEAERKRIALSAKTKDSSPRSGRPGPKAPAPTPGATGDFKSDLAALARKLRGD